MQKFWDSAMALSPNEDDEDSRRLLASLTFDPLFMGFFSNKEIKLSFAELVGNMGNNLFQ